MQRIEPVLPFSCSSGSIHFAEMKERSSASCVLNTPFCFLLYSILSVAALVYNDIDLGFQGNGWSRLCHVTCIFSVHGTALPLTIKLLSTFFFSTLWNWLVQLNTHAEQMHAPLSIWRPVGLIGVRKSLLKGEMLTNFFVFGKFVL